MTPLTHHDIVRFAAPLVRGGLRVDLASSARDERRILFHPRSSPDTGEAGALVALHSLSVLENGDVELTRAVGDPDSGLVATLNARAASAEELGDAFAAVPLGHQIMCADDFVAAFSWTLEPSEGDAGSGARGARLELRQIVGFAGPLCLVIDVSSSGGMPADALLVARAGWEEHLRPTLASGIISPQRQPAATRLRGAARRGGPLAGARTDSPAAARAAEALLAALPDDVLAVLGPHWRPLVWQGRRWKGVLRLLGGEPARSERAGSRACAALAHLAEVAGSSPGRYHERHAAARRRVFVRRLKPVMVLLAILAVMPLSWLLLSGGQIEMHPLALGLTPLMMVAVVLMSAREIPVLELPPLPRALAADRWLASAAPQGGGVGDGVGDGAGDGAGAAAERARSGTEPPAATLAPARGAADRTGA